MTVPGEFDALTADIFEALDRRLHDERVRRAEPITALGDFAFFWLEITAGRLVSGFDGAINTTPGTLPSLIPRGLPSRPAAALREAGVVVPSRARARRQPGNRPDARVKQ
jgi:hypothetical protein